ncbi:hypothetical protein CBM2626_A220081 [Cupriavidus taiwanensis]|nr:hypothetical protein CBM2626_A220081 [Cupriavidus taiwanensis]
MACVKRGAIRWRRRCRMTVEANGWEVEAEALGPDLDSSRGQTRQDNSEPSHSPTSICRVGLRMVLNTPPRNGLTATRQLAVASSSVAF